MSILKKLFTAVRGGAREVGESIVDANGIRIFEQEIADAKNALAKAKKSLTEVMAKEMQTKRKLAALDESIAEHEEYAGQALQQGNEALAVEIAEKIGEFETEKEEHQQVLNGFTKHVILLKQQVKDAEKSIKENQRQLTMVKTTESVQKATMAVNSTLNTNESSMVNARQSLERIKQRQLDRQDQLAAAKELEAAESGADLKAKMAEAGIGTTQKSNDILDRIKAKQAK
ncbi:MULTISPECIES: PspA/IM30 family protein [Pseudoalteromonas]|uniref:Phage shock protein A n=2 Tax=Pseudoalteromonas TaxID=53246 RepID=A0A0F4QRX2_9GAMM|nr:MULTISPECIES: PspA/IM30 family protein [Pseudoalteromonas]KJZ09372.1 phage-shock protein [Pseudoalteromonas rubra]MCF2908742.1 PspA/IM30 family protein [Pseudoalteromonas sp. DL2-H2.2]QTL36178.1 PspA/IM30 family protein [Pseudoalteromonas viridis]RZM83870.1 phage shock protein A [Pseudoalteromonas rubra]